VPATLPTPQHPTSAEELSSRLRWIRERKKMTKKKRIFRKHPKVGLKVVVRRPPW